MGPGKVVSEAGSPRIHCVGEVVRYSPTIHVRVYWRLRPGEKRPPLLFRVVHTIRIL